MFKNMVGNIPGGNFLGANSPGRNFLGGSFPDTVILVCNFVLTSYKNSPFINNKLFIKVLQYYVKTLEMFWVFQKNLINEKKCGIVKK